MLRILCFSVIAGLITSLVAAQESSESELEAISIGQAFAANWEQLRSCDLLLSAERFDVSVEGGTTERVDRYRLIADHDRGKYCFVQHSTREIAATPADTPVTDRVLRGFVYDRETKECWQRDKGETPWLKKIEELAAVGRSNFPDIRMVGYLRTPAMFSPKYGTISEQYQVCFHPGKEISERKLSRTTSEIVLDVQIHESGLISRSILVFDTQRYLPIQVSDALANEKMMSIHNKEHIKWKMIQGVYLPETVNGELIRRPLVNGQRVPTSEVYDVKMQWLSVNEPVLEDDEKFGKPQILLRPEQLLKMTQPEIPASDDDDKSTK